MQKDVTVTCPCCQARLVVDVLTGKVLREDKSKKGKPADPSADLLGDALKSLREQEKTADSRFKKAVSSEGERSKQLEDFFKKAREDVKDDEDSKPPSPFDFD